MVDNESRTNCFKFENINNILCYTCLVNDRKLFSFDRNSNVYKVLSHNIDSIITPDYDAIYLCWECLAVINRFIKYKQQVVSAFITLSCIKNKQEYSYKPLTNLKCVQTARYDKTIEYEDCELTTDKLSKTGDNDASFQATVIKVESRDEDMDEDYVEPLEITELQSEPEKRERRRQRKSKLRKAKSKDRITIKNEADDTTDDMVLSDLLRDVKPSVDDCKVTEHDNVKSIRSKQHTKSSYGDKFVSIVLSESEMQEARRLERLKKAYLYRPYKCETCILSYMELKDLNKHKDRFHKPKSEHVVCDICEQYVHVTSAEAHRRQHYVIYECVICCDRLYKMRAYHYEKKHDQKIHECKLCGVGFMSSRALRYHNDRTHRGTYTCEYCGKIFNVKNSYKVHLLIHTDTTQRECLICNKMIKGKYYYKDHMKLSHPTVSNPNAYCAECNKQFKNPYNYRSHLRTSNNHVKTEDRYACLECDKRFTTKNYMRQHIDRVHLKKYQIPCTQCDKVVTTKSELNRHIRRVHEGVEPIRDQVCEHCGKAFYCKKMLAQHMRQHTGERPFVCELCNANFAYSGALYTHRKLVHLKLKRTSDVKRTKT